MSKKNSVAQHFISWYRLFCIFQEQPAVTISNVSNTGGNNVTSEGQCEETNLSSSSDNSDEDIDLSGEGDEGSDLVDEIEAAMCKSVEVENEIESKAAEQSSSNFDNLESDASKTRLDLDLVAGINASGNVFSDESDDDVVCTENDEDIEDVSSLQPDTTEQLGDEKTENGVIEIVALVENSSDEDCENGQGPLSHFFSETVREKFKGMTVKDVFPEYRKNKPLRFSRLFGISPKYDVPSRYAHSRKRKLSAAYKECSEKIHRQQWFFEVEVKPEDIADEYQDFLSRPMFISPSTGTKTDVPEKSQETENFCSDSWREGPAKLWYDMYCTDDNTKSWYGLPRDRVIKEDEAIERIKKNIVETLKGNISLEEARQLLMINQTNWEKSVMWDFDDVRAPDASKCDVICAWVPSPTARTLSAFLKANNLEHRIPDDSAIKETSSKKRRVMPSFFPPQSFELLHEIWEEEILWDIDSTDLPLPKEFMLDPADERLLPVINDEPKVVKSASSSPGNQSNSQSASEKGNDSTDKKQMRRSKILLGKLENTNLRGEPKELTTNETDNSGRAVGNKPKLHRFNLSNDSFYKSKPETVISKSLGSLIHHSTPAVQLTQPFFPTYLSVQRLRHFHRWPLKRYSYGPLSETGFKPVKILAEYIELIKQEREDERQASGGGDMFYMRTADDLSGRDGDLVLAEYSEQHPTLMNQIGMSSKIRHYYKKGAGRNDQGPPSCNYGEVVYTSESPFLGNIRCGESLTVLENNMFRAPIYSHKTKSNDFLIIRCRDAYYIRKVDTVFTVGQQYPLIEVPSPNSKRASHFQRDFLTVFIYRLFWASKDKQKRIKMEDIRAAFGPHYSESSIRKRLKICADFKRAGYEQNWWNLKPDFRLPNEEELRRMVSPEESCAYYSMLAAEQRLRDAGYGDKAFTLDDNADDPGASDDVKVEDEVKCAPWNTTRAYLSSIQGKYFLDITGIADPTGCGEGFSFIRLPARMGKDEDNALGTEKKRNVTGTDADLRKLNLSQARQILLKHKIPEEEIKKLTRWEIIDVIRTLSTEKAKTGSGESVYDKFARIGKYGSTDYQEKYKDECQRIFEQQNKVLASNEVLSSDDESSSDEDEEDLSELAKNVETMMANRKSSAQIAREKEEKERKELQKMILSSGKDGEKEKNKKESSQQNDDDVDMSKYSGKILKIYRTFRNEDTGEEYQRVETVRKPDVIHVYMTIRETKDVAWMSEFAAIQQIKKEEERKKRRRYQDQLRRLERNKMKGKFGPCRGGKSDGRGGKTRKDNTSYSLKVKCGACGMLGHMKTNSLCPFFGGNTNNIVPPPSAPNLDGSLDTVTEDDGESLIKVEDTKITLGKGLLDSVDKKMVGSSTGASSSASKKTTGEEESSTQVYRKQYASSGMLRKRADPHVVLCSMFERLIQEVKQVQGSEYFHFKVREKDVPDYYSIVTQPMDLQKMRDKCMKKLYKTRNDFLEDINLIVCNSITYNGFGHAITTNANKISEFVQSNFRSLENKYAKLEKKINPLLDDNDQVGFSFLLREIVHKLKQIPESTPFHLPVSKKMAPSYKSKIKIPMDLDTLWKNCARHAYRTQEAFMNHVNLIQSNSEIFNGPEHALTLKAKEIVNMAKIEVSLHADYLAKLEKRIWVASQKSVESIGSSMSPTGFSDLSGFSGANQEEGEYLTVMFCSHAN